MLNKCKYCTIKLVRCQQECIHYNYAFIVGLQKRIEQTPRTEYMARVSYFLFMVELLKIKEMINKP